MEELVISEIITRFKKNAEELTATTEVIPKDSESLNKSLQKFVGSEPVLLAEPNDLAPELFEKYKLNKNVVMQPDKVQLANIKIGITDAFCGIASTGSVCVSVSKNFTSPASMLTKKHIVVVDSDSIVQRPRDIFSRKYLNGKGLNRSFSIITGPSATADMGPLVRGVHGPGKIHIIILK